MRRGLGTAMQVLAGAFGGGASSLGQSRMDQQRFDVADDQFDRDHGLRARDQQLREEQMQATERDRQERLGLQREQLDILGGLTQYQHNQIQELMQSDPNIDYRTARMRVLLRGSLSPNQGGSASPAPPTARPAAPRPPRPSLNR